MHQEVRTIKAKLLQGNCAILHVFFYTQWLLCMKSALYALQIMSVQVSYVQISSGW